MPEETLIAGRYRLLAEVGRGGMGTVWRAHDEALGRDVAVKEVVLPYGLDEDEREVQYKRTLREARTAARLSHSGVVTVYDVVAEDGRPWVVMEFVRARSLAQHIKVDGVLTPSLAAEVGRQMLGALHTAHDAGVLHRDVKPSNVLVTDPAEANPGTNSAETDPERTSGTSSWRTSGTTRAVLTDFGIATAQGDTTLTKTGLLMGSPAYIAPERARGGRAVPASDLWSLGVTLYTAVEGRSPFERVDAMSSLVAVLSDEPEPAPNAGPLRPVIEGLLRKDPAERMTAAQVGPLLADIVWAASRRTASTTPTRAPEPDTSAGETPGESAGAVEEQRAGWRAAATTARSTLRAIGGNRASVLLGIVVVLALVLLAVWALRPAGHGSAAPRDRGNAMSQAGRHEAVRFFGIVS